MKKTKLKKHLATGEYMSVLIITVTIMIEEKKKVEKKKIIKKWIDEIIITTNQCRYIANS